MRKNRFWDDGEFFWIEHMPSGKKALFERDNAILNELIRLISDYGSAILRSSDNFVLYTRGGNLILSHFLYARYHNMSLQEVCTGKTAYLDGNSFNLTIKNISNSRGDWAENTNRRIWHDNETTFLLHKKSGKIYMCDYEPELHKLLSDPCLSWYYRKRDDSIASTFYYNGINLNKLHPHHYQIVYAYHYLGLRMNNFVETIRKMKDDFAKRGFTIDHLNSDKHNSHSWNLSAMTSVQNQRKGNLAAKIYYPYFFFAAFDGLAYRIFAGHEPQEGGKLNGTLYLCENPDSLSLFLKWFISTKYDELLRQNGVKKRWSYDYDHAIPVVQWLLSMDESDFQIWGE